MNLLPMNAFSLASAVPLKLTAFIWLTRAKLLRRLLLRCQEPRDVFGRLECASVLFLFFSFLLSTLDRFCPKVVFGSGDDKALPSYPSYVAVRSVYTVCRIVGTAVVIG